MNQLCIVLLIAIFLIFYIFGSVNNISRGFLIRILFLVNSNKSHLIALINYFEGEALKRLKYNKVENIFVHAKPQTPPPPAPDL